MCNGFVLEQVCFHVVRKLICMPELSILNVWDIFKASWFTCSLSYQSTFLINIKALLNVTTWTDYSREHHNKSA